MLRKIAIFTLMFLMIGCAKAPEEGAAPPLIYVNDNLYIEQDYIKRYSSDWAYLGEIENSVSQGELIPEENFTANSWPVGTKVYMDEKERLWIRITQGQNKGKFIGYFVLRE